MQVRLAEQSNGLAQQNCFGWMPNFFIRESSVVRFSPRRAAGRPSRTGDPPSV
jgi:hypothetical protein